MILYRHSRREGKPALSDGWIGLQSLGECYPTSVTPHYTSRLAAVLLRIWQLLIQSHLWFPLADMVLSDVPWWPTGYDFATAAFCVSSLACSCFLILLGILRPPLGPTSLDLLKWFLMKKALITGPLLISIPMSLASGSLGLSLSICALICYPLDWAVHYILTEDHNYFRKNLIQGGTLIYRTAILTIFCFIRSILTQGYTKAIMSSQGEIVTAKGGKVILDRAGAAIWAVLVLIYSVLEAVPTFEVKGWQQDERVLRFSLGACDWLFVAGSFVQFTEILFPQIWTSSSKLTSPDLFVILVGILMGIWSCNRYSSRVLNAIRSSTTKLWRESKSTNNKRSEQSTHSRCIEEMHTLRQLQVCHNFATSDKSHPQKAEFTAHLLSWVLAHFKACRESETLREDCYCFLLKRAPENHEIMSVLQKATQSVVKQSSYKTPQFGLDKDQSSTQLSDAALKLEFLLNTSEGLLTHTLVASDMLNPSKFDSRILATIDDPKTANLLKKMSERSKLLSRQKFKVKSHKELAQTFEITTVSNEGANTSEPTQSAFTIDLKMFPLFLSNKMIAIKNKLTSLKTLNKKTKLDVCISVVKFLLTELKNPLAALVHLYKTQNSEFAQNIPSQHKHWVMWNLGRLARMGVQDGVGAYRTSRGPQDLDISKVFDFRRRLAQVENATKRILEAKIGMYETLYGQENLVTNYDNNFYKTLLRDGSKLYEDIKKNRKLINGLLNMHNKNIRLTIQAVINDLIVQERLRLSLRVETKLAEFAEWSSRRWRNDRVSGHDASTMMSKPNSEKLIHQVYQDETITTFLKYDEGEFRIRSSSRNAGPLFGVSAESLLQSNIRDFLPLGIQEHHDIILWKFLNGVESTDLLNKPGDTGLETLQSLINSRQNQASGVSFLPPIRSVLVPRSKLDISRLKIIPRLEVCFTQEVLLAAFLLPEKVKDHESFLLIDQTGKILGMRAHTHYLPPDLVGEDVSVYCPRAWPLNQIGQDNTQNQKSGQVFFRYDPSRFQQKGIKRAQAVLGKTQKFTSNLKRVRLDGKANLKPVSRASSTQDVKPGISLTRGETLSKPPSVVQEAFSQEGFELAGIGEEQIQVAPALSPGELASNHLAKGERHGSMGPQQLEAFDLKTFWINQGVVKTVVGSCSVECIFDKKEVETKLYLVNFKGLKEPDSNTSALISFMEASLPVYDFLKQDPVQVSIELEKVAAKLRNCSDLDLGSKPAMSFLPVLGGIPSKFAEKPLKELKLIKPVQQTTAVKAADRRQQLMKMRTETVQTKKLPLLEEDHDAHDQDDRLLDSEDLSMTTMMPPSPIVVAGELAGLIKSWTGCEIANLQHMRSLLMMLGNSPISSAQMAGTLVAEAPSTSGIQAPDLAGLLRMGLGKGRDVLGVLQGVQRRTKGLEEMNKNEADIEWEAKSSKGGSNMTEGNRNNSSAITRFNIKTSNQRLDYKPLEYLLYAVYAVLLLGWFVSEWLLEIKMNQLYGYQFGVYEISTIARPVGLFYRECVKSITASAILENLGNPDDPLNPNAKWLSFNYSRVKRDDQIAHYVSRYLLQSNKIIPFFQKDPGMKTSYNYSQFDKPLDFTLLDAGFYLESKLFKLNSTIRNNSVANRKRDLDKWILYESISELFFMQLLEFFTAENNMRKTTMKTTIIIGILKLVISFALLTVISGLVSSIEQRFKLELYKAVEILCKVSKTQLVDSIRHLKLKINRYNLDVMEIEQENEEIVTIGGSTVPTTGETEMISTTLGKAQTFHSSSKSTLKNAHGFLGQTKTSKLSKTNLYASSDNLKKATAILKSKGKHNKVPVHHTKKQTSGLCKRVILFVVVLLIINIPVAAEAFFIFFFASRTTKIMDTTATANFLSIAVYSQFAIQYKLLASEYLDESKLNLARPDWPFRSADTDVRRVKRKYLNDKMEEVKDHILKTRSLEDIDLLTMMTNLQMCHLIITIKSRNESRVCLRALPGERDVSLLYATQSILIHKQMLDTSVSQLAAAGDGQIPPDKFSNLMMEYFTTQDFYSNDLTSFYLVLSAKDLSGNNLEQVSNMVSSGKQILWIIFSSSALLSIGFLFYFKLVQVSRLDSQWRNVQQNFLLLNDDLLNNAYISMHFDKNSRAHRKQCTSCFGFSF